MIVNIIVNTIDFFSLGEKWSNYTELSKSGFLLLSGHQSVIKLVITGRYLNQNHNLFTKRKF